MRGDTDPCDGMSLGPLSAGETARFFAAHRLDGIDCLSATFRTHVYPPHMHETYVIGTIESGQTSQTLLIVRIDVFARLIQSKHHRTMEAVMLAENLAQHGESLF